MRDQFCRGCEASTAGDCGRHGPEIVKVGELTDDIDELTALRAEVARLKEQRAISVSLLARVVYACDVSRSTMRPHLELQVLDEALEYLADAGEIPPDPLHHPTVPALVRAAIEQAEAAMAYRISDAAKAADRVIAAVRDLPAEVKAAVLAMEAKGER